MKILMTLLTVCLISLTAHSKKDAAIVVNLTVTEKGFEPNSVNVEPDKNVQLKITRKTDDTCATSIQIPSKKIKMTLPLNKTVSIDLGTLARGEIRFGCGMNMMDSGIIYIK